MLTLLALALLTQRSGAFTAPLRASRSMSQLRMSYLDNLDSDAANNDVKYLSTIQDSETARKKAMEREHELDGIVTEADKQGLARNMDAYVDFGEGFDGGDGQVGVVGDGGNALQDFSSNEVTGGNARGTKVIMAKDMQKSAQEKLEQSRLVKDSRSTQILSFGSSGTGYAKELADKGMKSVDKYGEDKLQVRRQQLENWHMQQGLRGAQRQRLNEMDELEGGSSLASQKQGGSRGYFDGLSNEDSIMSKKNDDPFADIMPSGSGSILSDFKKEGPTLPAEGLQPGPAMWTTEHAVVAGSTYKIHVENPTMAFQDFVCGFTADSSPSFTVTPQSGTLERRNTHKATEITVIYKPMQIGLDKATLVIKTKARTWTHVLTGTTG